MSSGLTLRDVGDGCTLAVRVHPGAKRNGIAGIHDGALKVSLQAPPSDGRANDALIALLAERLGIPRARVSLLGGAMSRSKTLRIVGMSAVEVESALGPDLA